MTEHKRFSEAGSKAWRYAAMLVCAAFFLALVAGFYVPGKGFSALIIFGGNNNQRTIPELEFLPHVVDEQTPGYDGQNYVQLAIRPNPTDPELGDSSIDNVPYRARRILLCWTAYLLGLGQPSWVLQVYALQNVVCWLVLAWLLLRWFPPDNWNNFARWFAVLFSYGLMMSVRGSLVDGPSLLLIAWAVFLIEKGRRNAGTTVLAVAGLAKETNVLGAAALAWPVPKTIREFLIFLTGGAVVAVPLILWLFIIRATVPFTGPSAGQDNFAYPFVALLAKIRLHAHELASGGWAEPEIHGAIYGLVSLLVQFGFLVFRPRIQDAWWRVGATFAVLMIFLGPAVWAGYPGAASRVLLPMTLAFNVLLPRGWRWLPVFILGNLTVLSSWSLSYPPPGPGYTLHAPADLTAEANHQPSLRVTFGPGWYASENNHHDRWRWAQRDAELFIYNPTNGPLKLTVNFDVNAISDRRMQFGDDEAVRWTGMVGPNRRAISISQIILVPGENRLQWKTNVSTKELPDANARDLAIRVYNLDLSVARE